MLGLYEIAHDYVILGEDSLIVEKEQKISKHEYHTEPIENHFENFSKMLKAQKEKNQQRKALIPIETNFYVHQSPRRVSTATNCSSKHKSTYSSPKSFVFYDRQIRWLNQVRSTIKVKEEIQKQRESVECPFKPKKCTTTVSKVKLTEKLKPQKQRKDSYTTIHLVSKKQY